MSRNFRVPAVYLSWANSEFLAFFSFNRINNLRVFSVAFSSIPSVPSAKHCCPDAQSRGQQATWINISAE